MICINCHGPKADSNGRMAQNLATMTGGNAAVADFRDGLFGPVGAAPGHRNMDAVYGDGALPSGLGPNWTGIAPDDRAARYMAWMGLGGTAVNIPAQILQLVAVTKVLDQQRSAAGTLSANMLSQAKSLCLGLMGTSFGDEVQNSPVFLPVDGKGYLDTSVTSLNSRLIRSNGDAELWLKLCSMANPPPVRVLYPARTGSLALDVPVIEDSHGLAIDGDSGVAKGRLIPASAYPANTPVGDVNGGTDPSLTAANTWPWCVDDRNPASDAQAQWIVSQGLPVCPQSVKDFGDQCLHDQTPSGGACFGNDDANRWAVRGAINAGFSVFTYIRSIENSTPALDYDQCELLK
jgi:hypothetical protein